MPAAPIRGRMRGDVYGDPCPKCKGLMHPNKKNRSMLLCKNCGHGQPRKAAGDQSTQAWFTDRALDGLGPSPRLDQRKPEAQEET